MNLTSAFNTDEHAGVDCEGVADLRPGHDGKLVFISRHSYDRQKWVNPTSHTFWFTPQKKLSGAVSQLCSQIPSTFVNLRILQGSWSNWIKSRKPHSGRSLKPRQPTEVDLAGLTGMALREFINQ